MQIISVCPTPVDDATIDIFATYWVSEDLDYDDRLAAAKRMLPDDIEIWAHLRYLDDPRWRRRRPTTSSICGNGPAASIRPLSQTCAASPCRCTARAGSD